MITKDRVHTVEQNIPRASVFQFITDTFGGFTKIKGEACCGSVLRISPLVGVGYECNVRRLSRDVIQKLEGDEFLLRNEARCRLSKQEVIRRDTMVKTPQESGPITLQDALRVTHLVATCREFDTANV